MGALGDPFVVGNRNPLDNPVRLAAYRQLEVTRDFVLPRARLDAEMTARFATLERRQVAMAAVGACPIEHGPQELHQRCLAGLILPINDGDRI